MSIVGIAGIILRIVRAAGRDGVPIMAKIRPR